MSQRLKPFVQRVRLARSWKGAAIGLVIGSAGATIWAALDWFRISYAEPTGLAAMALGTMVLGALIGAFMPVSEGALGRSIDRRANLDDRLTTALSNAAQSSFESAQREDAWAKVSDLNPRRVFPLRFGRLQGAGASLSLLAACIFMLGNTPLLLSEQQKREKEEVKAKAADVERVLKEEIEPDAKKGKLSDEEKRFADELRRLQREMERARMDKAEALQKGNELNKKADELMRERAKQSSESLMQAETALQKVLKEELAKAGLENADPTMAQMSPDERASQEAMLKAKMEALQKQAQALQSALQSLQQKLKNPNLTPQERKALEEQAKAIEKELAANRKGMDAAKSEMEALKLSAEAQEVFNSIMRDPRFQELQKLAAKLGQNAQAGQQGAAPKLSKEELEEMRKKLEELAKELKDPEKLKAYLDALRKAIEEGMGQCRNGKCFGLGMGLPVPGMPAPGGAEDTMGADSGVVPKSDKPQKSRGKTTVTQIVGQRREGLGQDAYVEIKAPSTVGNRSSVPYMNVLPQYKKRAETAIEHDQIPKQHQKRVQQYFDSLTGGKK